MPSINFVLPHWLYWLGLLLFPLMAMWLSRKTQQQNHNHNYQYTEKKYSLATAYFVWTVGGFLGLHRLYLKNKWGMLFWPLFAIILYASAMERSERVIVSDARAELTAATASIERNKNRITRTQAKVEKNQIQLSLLITDDISRKKRLERTIQKETEKIIDLQQRNQSTTDSIAGLNENLASSQHGLEQWASIARYAFFAIIVFMLIDLLRIPKLKVIADANLNLRNKNPIEREVFTEDRLRTGTGFTGMIDKIALFTGEFVAFWAVIAVFVYYYEVIVRYVFNSPTNWAHESMFLMFGMQYLIAGAYAMLTESHVRVDIFYARLSPRGKAIADLFTSIFFFIFAGTLLVTGITFAFDAMSGAHWEVSFTEWAIQYWPVKCVIFIGAILLILQGISKICKDFALVFLLKNN